MITIADILALPAFETVELIAPCPRAATRAVHNVGILDCPPDYDRYEVYRPGEFIVTNLGFANGSVEIVEDSMLAMLKRGVSGIAIKTVYDPPITDAVRAASERCGIPVYLYTGAYHEMVAYQALDLLRRDELESDRGEVVDALLAGKSQEEVRRSVYDLAGLMGTVMNAFAISPKSRDTSSLYATLEQVKIALAQPAALGLSLESSFACRYHDLVLVLVSYESTSAWESSSKRITSQIADAMSMNCGVGSPMVLGSADLSIRQALTCLDQARSAGKSVMFWRNLGIGAFVTAARTSRLFSQTAAEYRQVLAAYDQEHATELMATAAAFVQAHGEVKIAAESLFQHPNTVRYRLRKIRSLLGFEEGDAAFLLMLQFMFLI